MGLLINAVHKNHAGLDIISVLTTCACMIRQVNTIQPSLLKTTSGMHHRPFECRHLVFSLITVRENFVDESSGLIIGK